jgi:hypothetical protein
MTTKQSLVIRLFGAEDEQFCHTISQKSVDRQMDA